MAETKTTKTKKQRKPLSPKTKLIIVIAFCLLISEILRMSPFLKKYLFGR